MLKYWIWVRFDSDSLPIRIGFESGRIPVRFDYPTPTQIPHLSWGKLFALFDLGK